MLKRAQKRVRYLRLYGLVIDSLIINIFDFSVLICYLLSFLIKKGTGEKLIYKERDVSAYRLLIEQVRDELHG
jgi:hypothetical protein